MEIDQRALVAQLTERMNDAMTAWVISGHYELSFTTARLMSEIPLLADSTAGEDGLAHSTAARSSWICMDGEAGSGVFLFPESPTLFNELMHKPVLGLAPAFTVTPAIYGNVDPVIWGHLGGAVVIPAHDFLS